VGRRAPREAWSASPTIVAVQFKQFLQNVFERVGLAEPPAPPPRAVDIPLAEWEQLQPIFARLAVWGVKSLRLLARDRPEPDELGRVVRQAAQSGMRVRVCGRASDLASGTLLSDAGASEIEFPLLSAIGEVHDALAGIGDYRGALRAMDSLAKLKLPLAAELVVVPSTWKTMERTLQLLADRGVSDVGCFAIACRDDEPSSWAISASELAAAAHWIEQSAYHGQIKFAWYPPQRFDPSRTLAQQVRRGPRSAADAVRIEPDGSVILPIGPAASAGNVLQEDWKPIARREAFRAWQRRREAAVRCPECPGLAACARGCLRDSGNWADYTAGGIG
jgi:radical SAM protein with 4Fe4S-binding SPASM domain